MKKTLLIVLASCVVTASVTATAQVYELRTYTANEGKLDALDARFRNHTVALFEKHGIESVGYWRAADPPKSENTLVYILKHESPEAATRSFRAFSNDPEWKQVREESERNGPILRGPPESVFMVLTDYSPALSVSAGDGSAAFELRTYATKEGKRSLLDDRSRDHAIEHFRRHGMPPVAFWHTIDEPDSANTLIYMLRHDSRDAATSNWRSFGSDPEWRRVKKESERDGRLTATFPDSIFLTGTDYSLIR